MQESVNIFFHSFPVLIFLAGAAGAFVSEVLKDNIIELPKKIDGQLYLGIVGAVIAGGCAGYFIDGAPETAFMGGFMGKELLARMLQKKSSGMIEIPEGKKEPEIESKPINETIEQMICRIAMKNGVDTALAVAVARCESSLNPKAINKNSNLTIDRGLYQWNNHWHPSITDEMAFNPEIACQKFCEAVRGGNLKWWSASAKCWNKSGQYKI